jgi:hypothetical protein
MLYYTSYIAFMDNLPGFDFQNRRRKEERFMNGKVLIFSKRKTLLLLHPQPFPSIWGEKNR